MRECKRLKFWFVENLGEIFETVRNIHENRGKNGS